MPLTAPRTVSLEFGSWLSNVVWPITSLAACPVAKSAATAPAAKSRKTEIHFMRNMEECVPMANVILDYSKPIPANRDVRVAPDGHTRVRERHASRPHPLTETPQALELEQNSRTARLSYARAMPGRHPAYNRIVRILAVFLAAAVLLAQPAQTPAPVFTRDGIVPLQSNAAKFLAPGMTVELYGQHLAPEPWCGQNATPPAPYPLEVCGVQVLVGTSPAGLMYRSE